MTSNSLKTLVKRFVPESVRHGLRRGVMGTNYAGRKYCCPMCDSRFRKFRPVGVDFPVLTDQQVVGGGRREANCAVCGSTDRERLIYLYLTRHLRVGSCPLRLLHVAPEPKLAQFLGGLDSLECLTADISGKDVMQQIDITMIPYPDCYFGAIICNHVLEHIIDDRRAMQELLRVLQPGGWAIQQVPMSRRLNKTLEDATVTSESQREEIFGQKDHVRIYAADYLNRLTSVGFEVKTFDWWTAGADFGGGRTC